MAFHTAENGNRNGENDTWLTPLPLIEKLDSFDLDPCGFPNHKTAKNIWVYPEHDGLKEKWFGRVYCNPPYSDVLTWLDKCAEYKNAVAIVFARTDTRWAQKHMRLATNVFFLSPRLKFIYSDLTIKKNGPNSGSMILNYGKEMNFENLTGWKAK